jgi:RNA polymerase sigma-54 factor
MLKQFLNLKLSQKLSPQQIQLMKLIQLPTQAFEQRLLEEMNENPALETGTDEEEIYEDEFNNDDTNDEFDDYDDNDSEDNSDINIDEYLSSDETPDYKTQANNYSDDDEERESPLVAPISFHQDLINQLNTFILNDEEREIAEFLVGSIDDMGYIRRTILDIVDDMAFTQGIYTDEKMVETSFMNWNLQELAHVIYRNVCCCNSNTKHLQNTWLWQWILLKISSMLLPKNITTNFCKNMRFRMTNSKQPFTK